MDEVTGSNPVPPTTAMSDTKMHKPETRPPVDYIYPVGVISYPLRTREITDSLNASTPVHLEEAAEIIDLGEYRRRKRMQEPKLRAWHRRVLQVYLDLTDPNR